MKTKLLAYVESIRTSVGLQLDALRDQINNTLPDDPPPPSPPSTPTGFSILSENGGNPHQLNFGWDNPGDGNTFRLQYMGALTTVGPQDWTDIQVNAPDSNGICANLVIQDPEGQSLLFRLNCHSPATNLDSDYATLSWP